MTNKTTGYIQSDRLAASTADEIQETLKKLKAPGIANLILDLQSKGGGYLGATIDIADEFLDKNKRLHVPTPACRPGLPPSTFGSESKHTVSFSRRLTPRRGAHYRFCKEDSPHRFLPLSKNRQRSSFRSQLQIAATRE